MIILYHGKTQLAIVNILSFIAKVLPWVEFPLSRRSRLGASIARGCPRTIGQKPEPTIRREMERKNLPLGGRGTTKWWKEPAGPSVYANFIVTRSPSPDSVGSSLPEGAYDTLVQSLGVWALPEVFVIQRRNWR